MDRQTVERVADKLNAVGDAVDGGTPPDPVWFDERAAELREALETDNGEGRYEISGSVDGTNLTVLAPSRGEALSMYHNVTSEKRRPNATVEGYEITDD